MRTTVKTSPTSRVIVEPDHVTGTVKIQTINDTGASATATLSLDALGALMVGMEAAADALMTAEERDAYLYAYLYPLGVTA